MAVIIGKVEAKTPAEKAGIVAGETLLTINGNEIGDVLDYRFYITERHLKLTIADVAGKVRLVEIKKPQYDDIGLSFETYLMDKQRSCNNHCVFCFIDQNPEGMRESCYFKDDDDRMSFLFGNYITLTNITEEEIHRIIKMRISPINISVHTTNPELRVRMMANKEAGSSLRFMQMLIDGGIDVNTQLVLCPGLNDGEELKRTLKDLEVYCPQIGSICCVPVGLTDYRKGLYPLVPFTKETAAAVIDTIDAFGDRMEELYGDRIAYASDEFFLTAEREIPPTSYYGDYKQLDNGVGLLALLQEEFTEELDYITPLSMSREISLVTGKAAYPTICKLAKLAEEKDPTLKTNVLMIPSLFFGERITVAGLVCGGDIQKHLVGRHMGDRILIPDVMLRHEGDLFLDNMSIDELQERVSCQLKVISSDGRSLAEALLT